MINSSRTPPKDHKLIEVYLGGPYSFDGYTPEQLIKEIQTAAQKVIDPIFEVIYEDEFCITGFIPMTEKEKATAERRRARSKEARARKKLSYTEKEKTLLKKLAKQYPDIIKEIN